MEKTLLIITLIHALLNSITPQGRDLHLVPSVKKAETGGGKFYLQEAVIVLTPDLLDRERVALSQFEEFITERTGVAPVESFTVKSGFRMIILNTDQAGNRVPVPDEKAGPGSRESYRINISRDKITVDAMSDAGLFYALKTLKQLIATDEKGSFLPEAEIEDYPSLPYRGVMMDFSHGGLLTEDEIKRQIDFLSGWKLNQYYFYNEVSIEMKGYPLINYNARYTQEQIKRIISYGRERHVDVIPFVEFYGHLHEVLRLEKYASLGIGKYGHDVDPRNSGVQSLLKDWIRQYAELFPGPFIHIGFDETWETERLKSTDPSIVPEELYLEQLNFVASELQNYGRKVMVWTDISRNYPGIISRFPKEMIPVIWEYSNDPASVARWIEPVKKENMPFFVQSAVDSWGNVYPASDYTFNNIDICLNACHSESAEGYITSVWTDAVQPLLRNTWLFMAYGSAGAWQDNPPNREVFLKDYCLIMYPGQEEPMLNAFKKMTESEDWLVHCLGRHTLSQMWEDPFSAVQLKNTAIHEEDFRNARESAEEAQESLEKVLEEGCPDTAFIRTLLVNCRQLDYTAARFIWAKTIVDRWNWIFDNNLKGEKDHVLYYDINYTTHGLITDMMDFCTQIKEEYRRSWLSENLYYRLGTISGRFDSEYLLWRNMYMKIALYINHKPGNTRRQRFEKLFLENK
jgi:hexosaminidase